MKGADHFDAIMARLDSPMAIVTTASDENHAGCLVGFHSQSGIEPSSLSVWLSKANHTFRVAVFAEVFAVHFLTQDDMEVAELFGTLSGDDVDKFERCRWTPGPEGVPLLDDCANRAIGRKVALLDTQADHVCLVLDPVEATYGGEFDPLRLSQVAHLRAGHEAEERHEPADTRAEDASGVASSDPS
jgi:flavin reductase (DIM6/NTAB) family NADH-FMN oxidoreductase RutF